MQFARQSRQQGKNLAFAKCCDVANYYLGFNGWSISVASEKCNVGPSEVVALCEIRLSIKGINDWTLSGEAQTVITVPGSEERHSGITNQLHAIGLARKLAYQHSCEKAFSKLIIIVLPSGKMSVHKICDDE